MSNLQSTDNQNKVFDGGKMNLTRQQYNHILEQFIDLIVDGLTYEELYRYVAESMEETFRDYYSTGDKLLEEIESTYDRELVDILLGTVGIKSEGN
jgi:hypothetical protein